MQSSRRIPLALCAAVAAAVALMLAVPALAQVATIGFTTFTSKDGLSDNYVLSAMQDSRGFLWFGTRDGLNRFDGYSFVVYRHDPENPGSIGDGSSKCIFEDARGRIWIGTHSGGLDCFDRATETFCHFRHDPRRATSIGDGPISSICDDPEGDIWVATQGRGFGASRLDPATGRFTRFAYDAADRSSLSANNVTGVCRDSSGAVWVATANAGLNRYDPMSCGFINHRIVPAYACAPWGVIKGVAADPSGCLWLLTDAGLVRFDPRTGSSRAETLGVLDHGRPPALASILRDREGTYWLPTYTHGLIAHNPRRGSDLLLRNSPSLPNSIASNVVLCACQDNAGNIWFGTENGLSKLNRRAWQFRLLRHDPSDSTTIAGAMVRSLALDSHGALWAGTAGGGLDRIEPAAGAEHIRLGKEIDPTINTILIDRRGGMWIGANNGLVRRDPDGRVRFWNNNPRDPNTIGAGGVWSILEDRAGRIWVGTLAGGLNVLDSATGTFRHFYHDPANPASLSDNAVICLMQSRDGAIWAGTDNGLNRLDPRTGRCRHFRNDVEDSASLSNNRVWFVHEDRRGALWIATSGGGVNCLDPSTGRCRRYMENNGMINNTACAIVEDARGRMWVSTNKGLACIDPARARIRNFGPADGLPVYEFHFKSCALAPDGTIYFGGRGGVVRFHPDSLVDNAYAPPMAITAFGTIDRALGRLFSAPGRRSIQLEHEDNSFSIEFAALDFTNPDGNHYKYMLEGYDRDWRVVPAAHRFAEYTNVPPDRYRFVVAGANADGVWSTEAATLDIVIAPAYWQTWWFRSMAVAIAAAGLAGLLMARVRGVRRKEVTERRVVEFQLQALRAQMNPHFLFNSLNSILYFVVKRDIESAQFYLTAFSSLVRTTLENVRNDAVPLADELESLRLYLEMESLRFAGRFDVSIDVSAGVDPAEVQIPPMIIQPYVENAIRHGLSHKEDRGALSVTITQRMGYLRCSIADDGVGRRRSEEIQRNDLRDHRAHGMAVTRNRLEALSLLHRQRYRVSVTDLVGDGGSALGTRIDILIPIDVPSRTRSSTIFKPGTPV